MDIQHMYSTGMSIPMIAEATGIARSTVYNRLKTLGVLRSRADGVRAAAKDGRLGSGFRGKTRVFTAIHCERISEARLAWSRRNSAGMRETASGYLEHTTGPHKGRLAHVVIMESRLGRRLRKDECVHHIDGDKKNNDTDNLALLTLGGHTRLHSIQRKSTVKE